MHLNAIISIRYYFYSYDRLENANAMTYTYLDLIEDVLRSEKRALSLVEIWNIACVKGWHKKLRSVGNTPINTMNSCIRKHIKTSSKVRFRQISQKPALYFLNN